MFPVIAYCTVDGKTMPSPKVLERGREAFTRDNWTPCYGKLYLGTHLGGRGSPDSAWASSAISRPQGAGEEGMDDEDAIPAGGFGR